MSRRSQSRAIATGVAAALLSGCPSLLPGATLPPRGTYLPGQLLVEFAHGTSPTQMKAEQQEAGVTPGSAITSDIWTATVAPGAETGALARLAGERDVLHAEPAYQLHDDMVGGFTPCTVPPPGRRILGVTPPNPLFNPQNGLPGQWGLSQQSGIDAVDAWSVTEGQGVEVAVVDTGVDMGHPDLAANIDTTPGYAANYYDPGQNPQPYDDFGHGTHVAGIIAAQMGQLGTVGVAPQAKIIPIRVLGVDGGSTQQLIEGLDHVLQTPAKIVNLSLGSQQPSAIEQDEIDKLEQAGILVVAAAGNEALDGDPLEYPASYPGVVSVAATKPLDPGSEQGVPAAQWQHADFSNFDPFISVAAPGVDILSTVPRQFFSQAACSTPDDCAYAYASGTSMATPFVSGVAALILASHPSWSAQQIIDQLLKTSAEPASSGAGFSVFYGFGVIDARTAVSQ